MSLFLPSLLYFLCVRHTMLRFIGPYETPNITAVLYRYRAYIPVPERLQGFIPGYSRENYAPLSTFEDQAAAGITSSTFDIEADNISPRRFQGWT